jgi:uncharacterized repeat protein (TIGR02543 family)
LTAPISGPVDLFAHWSKNSYTVTLDPADGDAASGQTVPFGDTATEPVAPARTGYTFTGWYTAATGGEAWDFTAPVTGTTDLFAQWTKNIYTVTFDAPDASNGTVPDQPVAYGDTAAEPVTPTRTGYTFTGWFTAPTVGDLWDFTTMVTGATDLFAHWTKNTYPVTFDAADTTDGPVPDQSVTFGDTATEPVAPARTGYTFTGWFTAETGGTLWDFTTAVTRATDLFAQWTKNTYTVTFDPGDGNAVTEQRLDYGTLVGEPAAPTRDGYTFTGWYTAPTGGEQWDFTTPLSEGVTLYAQWTAAPVDDSDGTATGGGDTTTGGARHNAPNNNGGGAQAGLPDTGNSVPVGALPGAVTLLMLGAWLLRRSSAGSR